jgi:hypothetical protein
MKKTIFMLALVILALMSSCAKKVPQPAPAELPEANEPAVQNQPAAPADNTITGDINEVDTLDDQMTDDPDQDLQDAEDLISNW